MTKKLLSITFLALAVWVAGLSCHQNGSIVSFQSKIRATSLQSFQNDQGYTIALSKAYLTLFTSELLACETAKFQFFPSAFAHGEDSGTEIGTTQVIDLTNGATSGLAIGTFSPGGGSFCAIALDISPADEDALSLPTEPTMVGSTLYLSGSYSIGAASTPFEIQTANGVSIQKSLTSLTGTLTLVIEPEKLFANMDFEIDDSASLQNKLILNVQNALSIE